MGSKLSHNLLIYAFGAKLGGENVVTAARLLAQQSGIAEGNLTLLDRADTYAHNDPAGAYPKNDFVAALLPFLSKVAPGS